MARNQVFEDVYTVDVVLEGMCRPLMASTREGVRSGGTGRRDGLGGAGRIRTDVGSASGFSQSAPVSYSGTAP